MVAAFGLPMPKLIITMSSATATFMALSFTGMVTAPVCWQKMSK
jgi:hypothetical protein